MSFSKYFIEDDEQVELSFGAKLFTRENMKQTFGCAIAVYTNPNEEPFITESVWSNKKPQFTTKMRIIPRISNKQIFRIVLLEMTPTMKPISEYNKIGEATVSLGRIIVGGGVVVTLSGASAEVSIEINQQSSGRGVLSMIVAFYNMPKNHWLMKNYPQLRIYKHDDEKSQWTVIYTSEVIKRSEAGQWAPISLPCRLICGGDYSKVVRLSVVNSEPDKEDYPIGYCKLSVQKLSECRNYSITLTPNNPKQARAGSLIIRAASLVERLTFYGHIKAGLRFNFSCAIDFAASNRPPRDTKSLHYTSFGEQNTYQATISAIGGAIEPYADGHPFYAWGFAAKYNRILSQCFPLTAPDGNPKLNGVKDLQNAYWGIFEFLQFDKPIMIVPSTKKAIEPIKGCKDAASYLVFLILLDDIPVDLEQFIDLLLEYQFDPLSVLVVGIGDADFTILENKLNAERLTTSAGKEFERDLISFVKFNDWGMDAIDQMTSTLLFHVPDQAIHWVEVNTL